jgi:hypothetical protein
MNHYDAIRVLMDHAKRLEHLRQALSIAEPPDRSDADDAIRDALIDLEKDVYVARTALRRLQRDLQEQSSIGLKRPSFDVKRTAEGGLLSEPLLADDAVVLLTPKGVRFQIANDARAVIVEIGQTMRSLLYPEGRSELEEYRGGDEGRRRRALEKIRAWVDEQLAARESGAE